MSTFAPQLLTPRQVAERLNVDVKTVRRMIDRAEFPALKVGGSVRIDPAELEHYIYKQAS
jgi:excisionase family DNA binding protein